MSSEKTEQPTPKRLRDSREKGQVAKSQDVPSALTVMAVAVYLLAMSSDMLNTMLTMGEAPMLLMDRPFEEALPLAVTSTLLCALRVALPLIGMVMVVALCANLMQVGVLAQRMIETAREEGIPIMRNVPLARSLYEQGTENAYIPQDLIGPVAEVLRWVQSLRQG